MAEFEFKVTPIGNNNELIVRQGDAPIAWDPEIVCLTGTITGPGDYVAKRKPTPESTHVVADYKHRTIALRANESDHFGASVTGSLEIDPRLAAYCINVNKEYFHKELYALLRLRGMQFLDRGEHEELLANLKKFESSVSVVLSSADDLKGSIAEKKITDIKTNLGLEFVLFLPVFTGGDKERIPVEICVGVSGAVVKFWFESVQLAEMIETKTEAIFDTELKRLEKYVIIRQW
jgi:hypothetical protein